MEALPEFDLVSPVTLADMLTARKAHPEARLLGGGTDLVVNIRRGIEAPPVLIETRRVPELRAIRADASGLEIESLDPWASSDGDQDVAPLDALRPVRPRDADTDIRPMVNALTNDSVLNNNPFAAELIEHDGGAFRILL